MLLLDPGAARRRREEAQRGARVECWTNPEGTATLTGRWLPPAEVLAADKRLCQVAAWWKKQIRAAWRHADPGGELPRPEHGTDLLRARAYLALLLGQPVDTPPADLLPPAEAPTPAVGVQVPVAVTVPGPAAPAPAPDAPTVLVLMQAPPVLVPTAPTAPVLMSAAPTAPVQPGPTAPTGRSCRALRQRPSRPAGARRAAPPRPGPCRALR